VGRIRRRLRAKWGGIQEAEARAIRGERQPWKACWQKDDRDPAGGGDESNKMRPLGGRHGRHGNGQPGKGSVQAQCIVTLVDRKSGYLQIGLLGQRTVEETNNRIGKLIDRNPGRYRPITAENGCEFHGYKRLEEKKGVIFYFATPHHFWERGTNENTNGLIRQYLPKGESMRELTQGRCNAIAEKLNNRPRKRHQYRTPKEIFEKNVKVALQG